MCIATDQHRRQQHAKPALGYRAFDYYWGRLRSLYWAVGATGRVETDTTRRAWRKTETTLDDPREDADFGFHALGSLKAAREWRDREVYGLVRGSDVVVRHLEGAFRSRRMTIRKLYVIKAAFDTDYHATRAVKVLRKHYKVPVVVVE